MSRLWIVLLASCLFSLPLSAQNQEEDGSLKEQIWNAKVAYFTGEIGLTKEESQVFWPIYNEYWKASQQAHRESRKALKAIVALEELGGYTEAEMKSRIDAYVSAVRREGELLDEYKVQFLQALPVGKVARMYVAEEGFRERMIRMWKDKENPHRK